MSIFISPPRWETSRYTHVLPQFQKGGWVLSHCGKSKSFSIWLCKYHPSEIPLSYSIDTHLQPLFIVLLVLIVWYSPILNWCIFSCHTECHLYVYFWMRIIFLQVLSWVLKHLPDCIVGNQIQEVVSSSLVTKYTHKNTKVQVSPQTKKQWESKECFPNLQQQLYKQWQCHGSLMICLTNSVLGCCVW